MAAEVAIARFGQGGEPGDVEFVGALGAVAVVAPGDAAAAVFGDDYVRGDVALAASMPIEVIAPLATIDAVEIYRRPAEIPVEYGMTQSGSSQGGNCGVIVVWTKTR